MFFFYFFVCLYSFHFCSLFFYILECCSFFNLFFSIGNVPCCSTSTSRRSFNRGCTHCFLLSKKSDMFYLETVVKPMTFFPVKSESYAFIYTLSTLFFSLSVLFFPFICFPCSDIFLHSQREMRKKTFFLNLRN